MKPNSSDSSPATSSVSSATQDFLKAADSGNDRKKHSAAPLNNSEGSGGSDSTIERPLAEVISEKFLPFDSATYIVTPFNAEAARDAAVHEGV
jgi:hypothetical protein